MPRLLIILVFLFTSAAQAQNQHERFFEIAKNSGFGLNGADFFQNNKMNFYDVKYLKIDITVQPKSKFITANCSYKVLVSQALDTFAIEFKQNMELDSVYLNNTKAAFTRANDHIYVPLQPVATAGTLLNLSFYYKGNVAAGFFAGTDANGLDYSASLSEAFQAREWFPAKQLLNDKIDSTDIWITTGSAFKSGSNGLLKTVIDLPGNLKQYRWSCRYPLSYYMPSVAVGNYLEYNNYAKPASIAPDSILVQNLVYNSVPYFNQVKPQLDKTPRFIEKFSELFGIYPFYREKYGHSQADIGGGMEHATMTTIKNFEEQLVAHELAHQWFGDNVTCASWNDIWVNESFATYSQYLAVEYLPALFPTTAAKTMADFHSNAMSSPAGSVYVPPADSYNEGRIFSYRLTYAKGATALHNLRFEMQNDTLFFNTLKRYQQQFANSFATTADFKAVAEQVSGKNLTNFFNQKIYGEGYPIYDVTYLKHGNDSLVLQVHQTTSAPATTPFFSGLMEYKILSAQGDTTIRLNQTAPDQTFSIFYPKKPNGVIVDPNNWVLDGVGTIKEGVSTQPTSNDFITVFPNPVKDNISIRLPVNRYSLIRVIDVNGRLLANYTIPAGTTLFKQNLHLPTGIYFLYFFGSNRSDVRKILVSGR
ncbi:M1 family aminopeptidase [Segetibacter aerophilus]|uniref:Aminopeptidase N n=1 Tax=Segetibacter aerophilus TaxID=670293 RepID=A0A512B7H7_9BACT|nr:M1 family aminopeptidase [Segetibacter aerophilus]GEO07921.1 peptidase M1 [Segetibacter aerophilus]